MDDIWRSIYKDFESGLSGTWRTVTAASGTRNELQFRLQNNIASYQAAPTTELIDAIEADVFLCNAMGYITDETATKANDTLNKIRGEL